MNKISDTQILQNCTGFGLMDKEVVNLMRDMNDPYPYLRGLLVEIGFPIKLVPYKKNLRKKGKSNSTIFILYDLHYVGHYSAFNSAIENYNFIWLYNFYPKYTCCNFLFFSKDFILEYI